jgi:hypothetical protein
MTQPHFYIFVIVSPLKRTWPFIWTNLNSLHRKRISCASLIKFGLLALEKKIFHFFQSIFFLFCYYLPLERGNPLCLNKRGIIPPKDDLCQVSLKLAKWFWRRFLNDPIPFLYFCDYLPFEEDLSLYVNNVEFPSSKDNLYHVWLNWACWFWRRFKKKCSEFLLFRYYLPLEKGFPLCLNNVKFPTPKDDLCQVWLKLAQCFWRRGFLNDPTPFFHFCDYFPFEEDMALHLYKSEFSSPKNNLYQVWLNLASWIWRRRFFSVYFYSFVIIGNSLHLKKLKSPTTRIICAKCS